MREAGETFAHYTIECLLGHGGMGEVYRAFDTKLHRRVALKLLLAPDAASDEARKTATARMIREARAAAAVDHPNKVGVHELGEVDGVPYIAMEYIAGTTLRAYVGDDTVSREKKVGWLLDVARALDAAHAAGLVHRDIKPENVMLREDGIVKVLDFGIARRTTAPVDPSAPTAAVAIETVTGAGVVIGTAAYMPPEQMHGEELDGRADQFAWGVMAFELLGGKHPWATTAGPMAMMTGMLTRSAPPLSDVWEDAPAAVSDALARTLSPKRVDRFPAMADLVAALATSTSVSVTQSGPPPARISSQVVDAPSVGVTTHAALTVRSESSETNAVPPKLRTRRRVLLAIASVVALSAVALAVGLRKTATPSPYEYCIAWNMNVQGPRCELAADEHTMGQRDFTYRLTSGPTGVTLVERLNGAGLPIGERRTIRTEIRRAPDGSVREVVARDQDNEEILHEVWSEQGTRVAYVEPDGTSPRHRDTETRMTGAHRRFDANGFVEEEMFVGVTGKPRADEEGTFGRRWERAPSGFVLREMYLAADGKPMAGRRGTAGFARVLGPRGVRTETRSLDVEGNTTPQNGIAVDREVFNDALGFAESTYFDAAGRPVTAAHEGIHGWRRERDPSGRKRRDSFFDLAGRPQRLKSDSFASMAETFDERGRITERTFLDPAGNPIVPMENTAIERFVWDEHDHAVEIRRFDTAGKPMLNSWACASRLDTYDARGRVIESRHLDEQDRLAANRENSPVQRYTHDDRGLQTEWTNLDPDLRPVAHKDGCAIYRDKYDRLRNWIELSSFGSDGKPCLSEDRLAVTRRLFDADDNRVEKAYFDVSGAPMFKTQDAKIRWKNDERGLVIEQAHFDTNDNLTIVTDGFAIVRYTLDRSGDPTEESYFGKRDEPVLRSGGYAKKKRSYDLARRRTESALFDVAGAPVMGSAGWAIERITYDDRGLVTREAYFDTAGNPVLTKEGSASIETRYDERGNVAVRVTLGTDGKPIATEPGFASKTSAYDERDLLIEESLLSPAGAPVLGKAGWATRKLRYDDLGNLVEEAFFDEERKPITAKDPAYAMRRDKYDARRRLIESAYYDPSGVRAKGPEGPEILRYVRDAYGHAVEVAHFDALEAPAFSTDGKHRVRSKFDDAGRLVEEVFVDASGAMRAASDGCAGRRHKYDERGREVEETCLDDKSGPSLSKAGWAMKRSLRDVRGNVLDEATYGPDGKLTADSAHVARRKSRFDERNLRVETTFFDASDKPTKDARGVAKVHYRYDDAGKQIEEILLDDEGKPVPPSEPKSTGGPGGR